VRGARNGHTTALFADECQSFLDNVIAGLGQIGSGKDPPNWLTRPPGPIRNCEDLPIRHGHLGWLAVPHVILVERPIVIAASMPI
jgi:hypothetical protein